MLATKTTQPQDQLQYSITTTGEADVALPVTLVQVDQHEEIVPKKGGSGAGPRGGALGGITLPHPEGWDEAAAAADAPKLLTAPKPAAAAAPAAVVAAVARSPVKAAQVRNPSVRQCEV